MKKIELSQGKFALVDDEDFEWLSQYKWYFHKGYARRSYRFAKTGKQRGVFMHRDILKLSKKYHTDHIDGNGLNNQRSNLRACTLAQTEGEK